MHSPGQYGVSDSPQFRVARAPTPHIFTVSHDNIAVTPPSSDSHLGHHPHRHPQLPHHLQAQQQQQQQQHHYGSHLGHQPHQQQIHQTQTPRASHAQHAQLLQHAQAQAQQQHSLAQLQQAHHQQQQQQQLAPHPPAPQQDVSQHQLQQQQQEEQQLQQQAQEQRKAQEQMVQQLGLGDPESPEVRSPAATRPSPTNFSKLLLSAAQDEEGDEEGKSFAGNRWPRAETLALIQIRSDMDASFRDSGLKGPLWEAVSLRLAEMGYHRNGKKCKEKFENIYKYYRKSKDGRVGRQDGKSYRYFAQLDALFGGQRISTKPENDPIAAVRLLEPAPMVRISPTEDLNVDAQRPSEISTAVALSKSSEDDYDEPANGGCEIQDRTMKKRKLVEGKPGTPGTPKLDSFETLVKNMVDNQEVMQRNFLESIKKIELERQAREEMWRKQDMARWAREHEVRAQEHALIAARDTALITFLQNASGQQTLTPPKSATPPPLIIPSIRDPKE